MPPPAATAVLVRAATSPLPSSVTPVGRPQGSTTINPQITQVPPNTTGVSNVAIYYVPRRFTADSKLHVLLAEKCPDLINRNNRDYNLFQVLTALKRVIASDKLYDPQNPTVVLCDQRLEEAIDVKALHVSEIREQVCKQFHPIISHGSEQSQHLGGQVPTGNERPNTEQTANTGNTSNGTLPVNSNLSTTTPTANLTRTQTQPSGLASNENRLTRSATVPATATVATGTAATTTAPVSASASASAGTMATAIPPATATAEPIILPSWASSTANAVAARQASAAPFNIEGRYIVKPAFLKVLRAVEGVNQAQVVFPYREVANILSKYIMMKKEKFFDLRNIRIALVEDDPLGEAFGVKAFARSQVTALMRAQLTPFIEPEQPKSLPGPEPEPENGTVDPKRKRNSDDSSDSSDADDSSSAAAKRSRRIGVESRRRHRRRSRNVEITIHYESASSSEETIYSAQGYETAAICDNVSDDVDSSDDASSSSDRAHNEDYDEENIYRVEYEIDSGSDDDQDRSRNDRDGSSAEDSDIEDVLIASAVTKMLNDISDLSNWADSDSEESDSENDFVLSTYDPELQDGSDIWKCVNCGQPNTPYMRYCHRCWEERKGWVPERANPRRRKKDQIAESAHLKSRNSKTNRSDVSEDSSAEHEICSTKQPEVETSTARFGPSISEPFGQSAPGFVADKRKASSDGEVDGKGTNHGTSPTSALSPESSDSGFSQDSVGSPETFSETVSIKDTNEVDIERKALSDEVCVDGTGGTASGLLLLEQGSSQSGDSGIGTDSQEMSQPDTLSSQATDDDVSCDDSDANDVDVVKTLMIKDRPKDLNPESSNRKRKMSSDIFDDSFYRSKRREELPSTMHTQKTVCNMKSVILTPDNDPNTPSTSYSVPSTPSFICTMCCVRPKDACFIHGQISHQVCCYPCAKMIFKSKGTCPVCRRRIEKITKNIVV